MAMKCWCRPALSLRVPRSAGQHPSVATIFKPDMLVEEDSGRGLRWFLILTRWKTNKWSISEQLVFWDYEESCRNTVTCLVVCLLIKTLSHITEIDYMMPIVYGLPYTGLVTLKHLVWLTLFLCLSFEIVKVIVCYRNFVFHKTFHACSFQIQFN